jgi:hypothetical protein
MPNHMGHNAFCREDFERKAGRVGQELLEETASASRAGQTFFGRGAGSSSARLSCLEHAALMRPVEQAKGPRNDAMSSGEEETEEDV